MQDDFKKPNWGTIGTKMFFYGSCVCVCVCYKRGVIIELLCGSMRCVTVALE